MREPIFPTRTRQEIAADNRAEIEGWIDERAAELVTRGMNPEEARGRALEEFGDVAGAERYGRGEDIAADRRIRLLIWLEELGSDLRIALRTLARTPTVTAVVLLTFALGIGATTAVFSLVHALLLRPLPYGDEQTLVYLQALDNGVVGPNPRLSTQTVAALRERTTSFTGITFVETGNYVIAEHSDPEQVMGASLSGNALAVLMMRVAHGRAFESGDESSSSPVMVLSDELWRRRFGADPAIVGSTIAIGADGWQVIGVMSPGVRVPTYEDAQFWAPRDISSRLAHPDARHVRVMRVFGRLKPGVTLRSAQADVDRTMRGLQLEFPQHKGIDARVVSIRTAVAGPVKPRVLMLMGAAGFVLLIACANVAGILLSRAIARRDELAVRIALGAGRRRLIRQFLAEGVVLAVFGAALGLLAAQTGIVALRHVATNALPAGTAFSLEPSVLWFALAAAVTGALLSSLVPAIGGTHVPGITLRRGAGRAAMTRANRRLRLALVAGQLAVSVVLLVGAGLFLRTLQRLSALDLGYSTENALTFRLQFTHPRTNGEQDVFWTSLYEQLRALPGVVQVGGGNMPLSGQNTTSGLEIEGRPAENGRLPDARYAVASDDYFRTLGIPVLRGRTFAPTDRDGAPWVAVISEGLANQLWPGGDPIGARVKASPDRPWATIVGVVGDVRKGSADPAQPSVYTAQRQDHWPGGGTVVIRATADPVTLMASVRQIVKRLDPAMPVIGLRTLEEFRRSTPAIADRRLQLQMILVFAVIALAVSAIGVYGVSAYAIEARRHEFGIRMALGASRHAVLWLSLRDGAQVALLGALAGVPLAWLLAARVRGMLYAVAPFDPLTVSTVLGALVAVVLAASLVPARRATLIDPARTMRAD
ncbi:MAG: ADOP family duplicated permease [Longimicrobiales bacterium]